MSTTIDERVVEMRFDNKNFERNAAQSISTLAKLKEKLNLKGAAKGLEAVNTASKRVDMNGLGNAVETVRSRFSALEIMGVTALANITNSAVNAGKRMVSALTVEPIMDGFQEYEMTLNAVQTTMAGTGKTAKEVEEELKRLDVYADKTVYSTADMLNNLPKFTNAGVELEKATTAMIGIANATAHAGGDAGKASIAFYNLGQAIGTGYLSRMDYNSINNAGIATMEWKNQMVEAAIAAGTLKKVGEDSYKAGKKTFTLQQLFIDGLQEQWATTDVMMEVFQDYGDETTAIGKKAYSSAQDIKTFSMMMDSLKATAGTGWKDTWQLIFGGLDDAKVFWTGLSNTISSVITKMADWRNNLIAGALDSPFGQLAKKIEKVTSATKEVTKATEKFDEVVNKVIGGEFGDGNERIEKLTKAGYDWAHVQNLVNEKLGNSTRHATKFKESQKELNKTQATTIEQLMKMSDAQLKDLGFSDKEIQSFKDLKKYSEQAGIPINDLLKDMDQLSGRNLLINSFKNIGKTIGQVFSAIGKAWRETFEAVDPESIYSIIAGFHKFTKSLVMNKEQTKQLVRTFKGLFAIVDIVTTVVGGGFKLAFKLASAILSAFDMNVLEATALLGDMIVKFRDFLFDNKLITKAFEGIAAGVKMAVEALKKLADHVKNSEVAKNVIDGLKNGLEDGLTAIPDILMNIGKSMLTAIKNVLGIHSPSKEMETVGKWSIEGLINGLKSGANAVWDTLSNIGTKVISWVKNFDWDKAFAMGASIFMMATVKKIVDTVDAVTAPFAGLGDLLSGVGEVLQESAKGVGKIMKKAAKVVNSFSKILNAKAWQMKADALKEVAISVAIVAASVYILSTVEPKKLLAAVVAIIAIAGVLVGLAYAMDKLTSATVEFDKQKGFNLKGVKTGMIGLAMAVLAVTAVVKIMSGMSWTDMAKGFAGLAGVIVAISVVFATYGLLIKGKAAQNMDKAGKMIFKMAATMLLMVGVCKLASMLSEDELTRAAGFALGFVSFVAALMYISTMPAGRHLDKIGGMVLKVTLAMILMIGVCKLASMLTEDELFKAAGFAVGFMAFLGGLMLITKIGKEDQIAKIGGLLMSVSLSMILMVGVCKLVGLLKPDELLKGVGFVVAFTIFIAVLVSVTKISSEEQMGKVAGTILAASLAIAIMAGVCILLGLINVPDLIKGVTAVAIFGSVIALMIAVTKNAQDVKGNLIAMTVAIGVMALAVAALSFIDPTKLAGATAAMAILMGMFALMTACAKGLQGSMGSLIVLTVAVGVIAGVIYLLSKLPVQQVLGTAAALSVLLISMSISMALISAMGPTALTGLVALAGVTAVVIVLAVILSKLQDLDVKHAMGVVIALSTFLAVMSGCCLILALVGAFGPAAVIGVVSLLALIASVGALMVGIGALAKHWDGLEEFLNRGLPLLEKIGNGIGSFFGGIVNGFGVAATQGLPQIADNLSKFMSGLTPFISGANSIKEETLTGVKSLVKMIALLSGASLLESISSWLTGESSMTKFGEQLREFGQIIVEFSSTVKGKIDESSVTAAANAGKLMAEMSKALPSSGGLLQKLLGEKDMAKFADQLVVFGKAIISFSSTVKGKVDESAVQAAANAGKIMVEMQKSIPSSGGLLQKLLGEKDMAKFGEQLKSFGKAIVGFSQTVKGKIDETAIQDAANAGKIMIEMQKSLVSAGGVVQWFTGEKDMAKFGDQIKSFGDSMTYFSQNTKVNEEAVNTAANAGKVMAAMQDSIPESKWFDGKMNLDEFGEMIVDFGKGLVKFSEKVSDVNPDSMNPAISSANRLAALAKTVVNLDTSGIKAFKDVKGIGEALKSFNKQVSDLSLDSITKSISAVTSLVRIVRNIEGLSMSGVPGFKRVISIGTTIKTYAEKVSGLKISQITGSINAVNQLRRVVTNLAGINSAGVSAFVTAVNQLAKTNVNEFVAAFRGAGPKLSTAGVDMINSLINGMKSRIPNLAILSKIAVDNISRPLMDKNTMFNAIGIMLMTKFVVGIRTTISKLPSVVTLPIGRTVVAIRQYRSLFITAGSHLGTGLIIGINSKIGSAYIAGYRLGQAAVQGEKDGQKSKSPSKLTIQNGKFLGEGLIIGIGSMMKAVYNKGYGLGQSATESISAAIAKISDLIENGVDEVPTIRPVLDLSAVEAGAGTIGSMFNRNPSVNMLANVKAVNASMTKHQNGSSDVDLLNEIKGLRDDFASADSGVNVEVNLAYNASADANEIANDIATNIRRVIRRK